MFRISQAVKSSLNLTYNPIRFKSAFNKVVGSIDEALKDVKSGQTVLVGGFGLCGIPENLLQGVKDKGINNLTIVSNNFGVDDFGPGILLKNGQIKRAISSYMGENAQLGKEYLAGNVEIEFCPQGTISEKCRSGGAGIPGFYTPTGVGTIVQYGNFPIKFKKGTTEPEILSEPKRVENFDGRDYIFERSIVGDIALIKAQKADTKGNLMFNKTARNMNADFATAGKITIAEVEEIVEEGEIDPNDVHVSGIYVDKVVKGPKYEKRIYKLVYDRPAGSGEKSEAQKKRDRIAQRAAKEVKNGMYVNLGIGLPTLIPQFLPPGVELESQSENGVLGVGKYPAPGQEDPDLINAGKETITVNPGASYFSSSQSFAIIRGKHLDLTILGGMQVSQTGDLANWIIPGKLVKGMGGAMDLVGSGTKVMVIMEHVAKGGAHKILRECNLPLTGKGVVDVLVTEMATFEFKNGEMYLKEIEEGYTLEDIKKATTADFKLADNLVTKRNPSTLNAQQQQQPTI